MTQKGLLTSLQKHGVELFDPIKAAVRMVLCLDYLLYLFGQRGLEEPLDSSFFVKEEAAALREGYIQLTPFRDRRGRQILIILTKAFSYDPKLRVSRCGKWARFGQTADRIFCRGSIGMNLIPVFLLVSFEFLIFGRSNFGFISTML